MAFLRIEEIFGERMSVSVLRLLAQVEGGLSGNETARRLGAQQSTVRKALERLVARGLVTRTDVGRAASYMLDERREAVRGIVIPAFQAESELRLKLWSDIVTLGGRVRPRPVALVLYGSITKGVRSPRDIDLLVVVDSDTEIDRLRDQLAEAGERFETSYLLPLSPVLAPKRNLETALGETLLQSVLRDGVLLYGEPVGALRRMKRWHRTPDFVSA